MPQPPPQAADARRREITRTHFATLAALFNPVTFGHMDRLGLAPGWRCWEAGAGGPAVPARLCERVGPGGYVLATDRDISVLQEAAQDGFAIRQHDLSADPAPAHGFDLVHTRLVLMHLPDPEFALATMIEALRPGGWLLVEEADPLLQPLACPDQTGPAQQLANKLRQAIWTLMSRRTDLDFGRKLPRLLREAGLSDVGASAHIPLAGPALTQFQRTITERQRDRLVTTGLASDEEIDRHLHDINAGSLDLASFPVVSAWGRKSA
jgi:SAM-dependent methyltransferase